jgi:hypothetical protein
MPLNLCRYAGLLDDLMADAKATVLARMCGRAAGTHHDAAVLRDAYGAVAAHLYQSCCWKTAGALATTLKQQSLASLAPSQQKVASMQWRKNVTQLIEAGQLVSVRTLPCHMQLVAL